MRHLIQATALKQEASPDRAGSESHSDRYSEPATPTSYDGACASITITTGSEDSIEATYKSPATGTYKIVRDVDGVWAEEAPTTP